MKKNKRRSFKGKSQAQTEDLASDEDEYDKTFFVPERARRGHLKDLKHDIGAELSKADEWYVNNQFSQQIGVLGQYAHSME